MEYRAKTKQNQFIGVKKTFCWFELAMHPLILKLAPMYIASIMMKSKYLPLMMIYIYIWVCINRWYTGQTNIMVPMPHSILAWFCIFMHIVYSEYICLLLLHICSTYAYIHHIYSLYTIYIYTIYIYIL